MHPLPRKDGAISECSCSKIRLKCGNVRDLGFKKAWLESEVFNDLRDWSKYKGKCGLCEFKSVCGGCRARAYAKYKDYLREEPYCTYEPKADREKYVKPVG